LKPQSNTRTELTSSSRALTTEDKHMEHECLNSDTEPKPNKTKVLRSKNHTPQTKQLIWTGGRKQ